MKTLWLSSLLAIGATLGALETQAGMMQSPGGNGSQQVMSQRAQPAVFIGRGYGFEGHPSPAAQFAQPGHSIVRAQPTATHSYGSPRGDVRHVGGFGHGMVFGHYGGRDHDHDRGHGQRHSIIVFVNGAPFWYPAYTDYPYYYDAPPPIASSGAYVTSDDSYVPPVDTSATDAGPATTGPDYGDLGTSWGQDLRRDVVTWDQFVAYLKAYVVTAPPPAQADFREGFINAYRINGAAAYDKAALDAGGNQPQPEGPKVVPMPPPMD